VIAAFTFRLGPSPFHGTPSLKINTGDDEQHFEIHP